VGKSTLFNRLVGRRQAIVDSTPGVTRDRIEGEFDWEGRVYRVSDLAGWDERPMNPFASETIAQIKKISEEADLIILLVDGKEGLTSWDKDIASRLRIVGTPILVVVNKCDTVQTFSRADEFYELGLGDPVPISATHNLNVDFLLDAIADLTAGVRAEDREEAGEGIAVAILGRQNVGKSTLFNALVGEHRAIVSEIPGTTRDSIDTAIDFEGSRYLFIDTAGMKKRTKIGGSVDYYAMRRTETALNRCEVAMLLIDCVDGVTETDTKIGGLISDAGRACVVVASKWDYSEDAPGHRREFERHVRKKLHFIAFAPICFTSGLYHEGVEELLPVVSSVHEEFNKRVPTAVWNKTLADAVTLRPPPTQKGKPLKMNYITQTDVAPPTLTIFVNQPEFLRPAYKRYLEKHFRAEFGFQGSPLIFNVRRKSPKRETAAS
jgi:GTP-binding protein